MLFRSDTYGEYLANRKETEWRSLSITFTEIPRKFATLSSLDRFLAVNSNVYRVASSAVATLFLRSSPRNGREIIECVTADSWNGSGISEDRRNARNVFLKNLSLSFFSLFSAFLLSSSPERICSSLDTFSISIIERRIRVHRNANVEYRAFRSESGLISSSSDERKGNHSGYRFL